MDTSSSRDAAKGTGWRIAALALAASVTAAAGYLVAGFAPRERERAVERWRAQLSTMADDRRAAVDRWLEEVLAQARVLAEQPDVVRLATTKAAPEDGRFAQSLRERVERQLDTFSRHEGDRSIALLDGDGRPLASGGAELKLEAACLALPRLAFAQRRALAGFHLHAGTKPLLQVAAPVITDPAGSPRAVALLTVDPERWLYPFLRHQPLASASEETLLAGREGAEVVFLSRLRHRPDQPTSFRLPASTPGLAAAAAFHHDTLFAELVDYRGAPVLAATRALRNAPWRIVAKVDRAEALAAVDERVRSATLAVLGVSVALLATFGGAWATLRSRNEARAAREKARLSLLLDQASDALLVVSADGVITDANQTASALYGYPRAELLGMHFSQLLPDRDAAQLGQRAEDLRRHGKSVWQTTHATREGRPFCVEVAARAVELDGEPFIVAVVRDVSERLRAESALRASEARLRALFDAGVVGLAHADVHGGIRAANDVYLATIGRTRADLEAGRIRWRDMTPAEFLPLDDAAIAEARRTGSCAPYEKQYLRPDGTRVWVMVGFVLLPPDREEAIALVVDIAERKLAEQEIRRLNAVLEQRVRERTAQLERVNDELQREVHARAQAQLAAERAAREVEDVYNRAPCGYHSLDSQGRFAAVNDTELEWLGYAREELIGKSALDVLTPASRELFGESYPRFKESGALRDLELEFQRKDGTSFWALVNASAVRDGIGRYFRSRTTIIDISELVAARRAVVERTSALEAANRELEAFNYSVSHDLRAPLRVIGEYARILADEHGPLLDGESGRVVSVIRENARRMSQLIEDLLAFSRANRTELHARSLSMRQQVESVLSELLSGEWRGHGSRIHVAELPDAVGDPALLKQVWLNLLSNALKFSAGRGEAQVRVHGRACDGELVYLVEDDGVGFDPRYAHKLFKVFQRLHSQHEFPGTGVGLALVQRIVERHGGRVSAESMPGEGAVFSFTLPLRKA